MNAPHVPLELVDEQGNRRHRAVTDCSHATLCRAFELDQATYHFDLPRTMASEVDFHAAFRAGRRNVFGYVFRGSRPKPVAIVRMLPKDGVARVERISWDDKINSDRAC